jgi:aspartyl-tRNA(Asn)/glutamyl-tRNA(Gln) amidotransferase subunit B
MRSKEESEDYRYFQEPDLLPLHVDDAKRAAVRQALPVLPAARRAGYAETGIGGRLAAALVATDGLGELFEEAMASGAGARAAANWVTGEVVAHARRMGVGPADTPLTGQHLAELAAMVEDGELSATAAKDVLAGVLEGEGTPAEVAAGRDLIQISDATVIEDAVDAVLADNADAVGKIAAGDTKPIGFLVGEVMKATGGKADPRLVSELIRSKAGG